MPALARFLVVVFAGLVTAASIGKLVPHVKWMVETFDVPLGVAGLLVSCVMVPGALAGTALGLIVDRLGARQVALGGLGLHALASFGMSGANAFGPLVLVRLAEGVGYSLLVVAATVLVVDVSTTRRRALALSVWSAFAPIGFALGQWASALVQSDDRLGAIGTWHGIALIAAAGALALAVPARRGTTIAPGPRPAMPSGWATLLHPPALRTAAAFGCVTGVLLAGVAVAPVALAPVSGLTVAETARLTALAALPGVIGRFLSGWLLDRDLSARAVFLGASITGIGFVLAALVLPVPFAIALACFAGFQICIGALPGVLSAMLPQVAHSPEQLGFVSGLANQLINLGNLLGPPLALAVLAAAGAEFATLLLAGVVLLGVVLVHPIAVFRAAASNR